MRISGTFRTMTLLTAAVTTTLALTGGMASAQSLGNFGEDPAPVAPADPAPVGKIGVGAGTSFGAGTPLGPGKIAATKDHCTIAAVGRDNQGALVALSAAHCAVDSVTGTPIELWVKGEKVGQFESWKYNVPEGASRFTPGYYDFAFARLDESKVHIAPDRGANVSAGLLNPNEQILTGSNVCFSGLTSGKKCGGYVGDGGTTPREHVLSFSPKPGDSGGPLYTQDGKLLGIASRGIPGAFYGDVRDAASYAATQGWVGGGFRPIG